MTVALTATLSVTMSGCSSGGDDVTDAGSPDASVDTGVDTGVDATPPPPPALVADGVRWVGRVDLTDPTKPRFSWSGTGFVARFSGTGLTAQLGVAGAKEIFKTVIDGTPQAVFTADVGQKSYPLATGLTAGEHTVEVYRQTEGPQGESQLLGLTVADGVLLDPPAAPGRLIEVIGDSITCGYGDLGALADAECFGTESHWDTYEAVAARALGADVSTIAASGRGVVRNYGGDVTGTMPLLYPLTLTNLAQPTWDFSLLKPQAVVINLGTNDISNNKGDPGTAFSDTYAGLLQTVRTAYPDAYIVCIIGPLLGSAELTTIAGRIQAAVDMRTTAGDTRVEFFNQILPQTPDKFACQYHPNVAENMLMATQLAAELQAKLGW